MGPPIHRNSPNLLWHSTSKLQFRVPSLAWSLLLSGYLEPSGFLGHRWHFEPAFRDLSSFDPGAAATQPRSSFDPGRLCATGHP